MQILECIIRLDCLRAPQAVRGKNCTARNSLVRRISWPIGAAVAVRVVGIENVVAEKQKNAVVRRRRATIIVAFIFRTLATSCLPPIVATRIVGVVVERREIVGALIPIIVRLK